MLPSTSESNILRGIKYLIRSRWSHFLVLTMVTLSDAFLGTSRTTSSSVTLVMILHARKATAAIFSGVCYGTTWRTLPICERRDVFQHDTNYAVRLLQCLIRLLTSKSILTSTGVWVGTIKGKVKSCSTMWREMSMRYFQYDNGTMGAFNNVLVETYRYRSATTTYKVII